MITCSTLACKNSHDTATCKSFHRILQPCSQPKYLYLFSYIFCFGGKEEVKAEILKGKYQSMQGQTSQAGESGLCQSIPGLFHYKTQGTMGGQKAKGICKIVKWKTRIKREREA